MTNILSAIDAAEYLIAHNASHVVKQVRGYAKVTRGDVSETKNGPLARAGNKRLHAELGGILQTVHPVG